VALSVGVGWGLGVGARGRVGEGVWLGVGLSAAAAGVALGWPAPGGEQASNRIRMRSTMAQRIDRVNIPIGLLMM
jgi:hypothetical protein